MLLIIAVVALAVLRFLEVGPLAEVSWWWIGGAFAAVFVWFEFLERRLGLDRKRDERRAEKERSKRIERNFKQ